MIVGSHPSHSPCNHRLLGGGGGQGGAAPKGLAALGWGLGQPDPRPPGSPGPLVYFRSKSKGFGILFQNL